MAGSAKDVVAKMKKEHGEKIVVTGNQIVDFERLPIGIFDFDLAIGGGLPRGKMNMIFGPNASGKTTIALLLVANFQRLYPHKVCVWIDAEWAFDKQWAMQLGVDVDKLIVVLPETGEQAAEIAEGLAYTTDTGLVIIDSIAAMVPDAEVQGDVGRMQVGGNSMLITQMVKKVFAGLNIAAKDGSYPTFFLINQMRTKIGVIYGSDEKIPGGNALMHYCNMILRIWGKDKIVKEVNPKVPAIKEMSFIIKKKKCPVVEMNFAFEMALMKFDGNSVGHVEAFNKLINYAKQFKYIVNTGKKWEFNGGDYKTLTKVSAYIASDIKIRRELEMQLIADAVERVIA